MRINSTTELTGRTVAQGQLILAGGRHRPDKQRAGPNLGLRSATGQPPEPSTARGPRGPRPCQGETVGTADQAAPAEWSAQARPWGCVLPSNSHPSVFREHCVNTDSVFNPKGPRSHTPDTGREHSFAHLENASSTSYLPGTNTGPRDLQRTTAQVSRGASRRRNKPISNARTRLPPRSRLHLPLHLAGAASG